MSKPIEEFIKEFTGLSPYVFKNMNKESEIELGYYFEDTEDTGYNSDESYDMDLPHEVHRLPVSRHDVIKNVGNRKLIESHDYLNKLLYHEYKSCSTYGLNVTRKQPEGFYIYLAVLSPSGNIVYIGCGRDGRYKHVNSGRSSSVILNQLYFLTQGCVDIMFIDNVFTNRDILLLEESKLIEIVKPYANVQR